jgi:hypothetical protein
MSFLSVDRLRELPTEHHERRPPGGSACAITVARGGRQQSRAATTGSGRGHVGDSYFDFLLMVCL